MATIFISHVEEDQALALEVASGLERAGYSTWYYERDSSPGLSYLLQVNRAIEDCQVVVLVISPRALDSAQVAAEVVRAHETGKSFLPLRTGISHDDFRRRKPDWSMAVGAAASIAVPQTGAAAILPEILEGLALLTAERGGRAPRENGASADHRRSAAVSPRAPEAIPRRRSWQWTAAGVGALTVALLALYGPLRDRRTPLEGDGPPNALEPRNTGAPPAAASAAPPARAPAEPAVTAGAGRTPAPEPKPPATAATRPPPRERRPDCSESSVSASRTVEERGRLEARDDVNGVLYAFVICEEHNSARGTIEMQIRSSATTGTRWSGENAVRKAADMHRRGVECEPASQAVRPSGPHDPRSIVYILCQKSGEPTSLAVHAVTRRADGSPHPEKVLRVSWPE